jgi:hypothetical protein
MISNPKNDGERIILNAKKYDANKKYRAQFQKLTEGAPQ